MIERPDSVLVTFSLLLVNTRYSGHSWSFKKKIIEKKDRSDESFFAVLRCDSKCASALSDLDLSRTAPVTNKPQQQLLRHPGSAPSSNTD